VGSDDLIEKIQAVSWTSTPPSRRPTRWQGRQDRRVLGPRGLMPNRRPAPSPRRCEGRVRDQGRQDQLPRRQAGQPALRDRKASFDQTALTENYGAALDEILRAKPASSKGRYLKKIVISTTTGPGIPVDPSVTRNFTEA